MKQLLIDVFIFFAAFVIIPATLPGLVNIILGG